MRNPGGRYSRCRFLIAEVDESRIETRRSQGWVQRVTAHLPEAFQWASEARQRRQPLSIAHHGNIVELLEYAEEQGIHIELLSDQTSCHEPTRGYARGHHF